VPTVRLNPQDLLPRGTRYYHYSGSLTTPPCSEGVAWFVMKTPIEVSATQVEQCTAAMHHNARPAQSLHDRVVQEKSCSALCPLFHKERGHGLCSIAF